MLSSLMEPLTCDESLGEFNCNTDKMTQASQQMEDLNNNITGYLDPMVDMINEFDKTEDGIRGLDLVLTLVRIESNALALPVDRLHRHSL